MLLNDFIKELGLIKRLLIRIFFLWLKLGNPYLNIMVSNIFKESIFDNSDWESFISIILKNKFSRNKTIRDISMFCQIKGILLGPTVSINYSQVYGRIVALDTFCRFLVKKKYYLDINDAKRNVLLRLDLPPNRNDKFWRSLDLGEYLMWATFNYKELKKPFGNPEPLINDLICSLGLEPMSMILLFEYKLPRTIKPKIPTICDAYAGSTWSKYFLRVNSLALCGLTQPTENCSGFSGKPEVVHEIVKANNITSPLRLEL